ncbi:MAG: DNA-binding protein [Variibacter sp.]
MTDKRSQVKARFGAEGVSIAAWARAQGFNTLTVYRVLAGRVKGTRGEAHKIAVALGLKKEPTVPRFRTLQPESPAPCRGNGFLPSILRRLRA